MDDPDDPAAPDGDSGFADWVQIAVMLMRVELDKSLRESEAWFNDATVILDECGLDTSPHYSTLCRWEQTYRMRELPRLLLDELMHLHGDHFGGIPFYILDAQFAKRTAPLTIAGPPGTEARVIDAMAVMFPGLSATDLAFDITFTELDEEHSVSVGTLHVKTPVKAANPCKSEWEDS